MTFHALNRKLAQFDGFTAQQQGEYVSYRRNGIQVFPQDLPQYTEDLNALRRIELKLTLVQQSRYLDVLGGNIASRCSLLTTSPLLRAEALLIVLGK